MKNGQDFPLATSVFRPELASHDRPLKRPLSAILGRRLVTKATVAEIIPQRFFEKVR